MKMGRRKARHVVMKPWKYYLTIDQELAAVINWSLYRVSSSGQYWMSLEGTTREDGEHDTEKRRCKSRVDQEYTVETVESVDVNVVRVRVVYNVGIETRN
jgi:hypothetical protein